MKGKSDENIFLNGNKKDGKHYWLTPQSVYDFIAEYYGYDQSDLYDPCPFPQPEGFNGLDEDWGRFSYVNPPFGVVDSNGKKIGATAWFRKAVEECKKGKLVFFVFPIHQWLIEAMIFCGAKVHHMGNVKWLATEDCLPGKGSGPIAMFVLDGRYL